MELFISPGGLRECDRKQKLTVYVDLGIHQDLCTPWTFSHQILVAHPASVVKSLAYSWWDPSISEYLGLGRVNTSVISTLFLQMLLCYVFGIW